MKKAPFSASKKWLMPCLDVSGCGKLLLLSTFLFAFGNSAAEAVVPAGTWYKIRTNGIPQSPANLVKGASGDLWMASESPNEKGAWRWPDGGQLLQITGDSRENDLGRSVNMTEKPELAGQDVNYAIDDAAGNTWYALQSGGVKVQKADNTWVVFDTSQPSSRQLADNMILRIRPGPSGTTMLIGPLGAYVVNSSFQIVQQRTGIVYNNDFINDVMVDSLGRWWVATNRGPYRGADIASAASVTTLYPGDANVVPYETPVSRMEQDVNGHIWFLANSYGTSGIYCLNASGTWEQYSSVPAIGSPIARDLLPTANGDVWFGLSYGNGLGRFRRGSGWSRVSMATLGIDSYDATSMTLMGGNIWFTSGYNASVSGNGTGVHKVVLDGSGDYVSHQAYTYTSTSTTVPSNRCRAVAADKSGNLWFGAYDRTAISRRKNDGTWETFNGTAGPFTINYGIVAIGVDSANIVYFYTYNATPFAFNANTETWVTLPAGGIAYPYGLYIDSQDGKWFHGSDGVAHLSADNTTWTYYTTSGPGTGLPSQYVDYGVRVDHYDNMWFGTRGGLARLQPNGTWTNFTPGASGYGYPSDGTPYKAILDDNGETWSQGGLKFNYKTGLWAQPADTTAWQNRNLPFTNGKVFLGPDTSRATGAIVNMTGSPLTAMDEDMMTLDTHGTVYQGQWAFSSDLGVVAYEQPADALTISLASRDHSAYASSGNQIPVTASRAWTATTTDAWISISAGTTGGGTGTVTYALSANANATSASRTGSIIISSRYGIVRTFTVNQTGMPLAPAGELLANPEFDTAAGASWQIASAADRVAMFATSGVADMHVSGFTGKLLWQDLNILNAGGMAFRVGTIMHSGFYPAGKSVAVYLDYVDGTGNPQRLLVLDPENRDIASAPLSSYFENQVTLPASAQRVTGFSVDRRGPGEFTAESFTLTALGYAIPITSLADLQSIGNQAGYPMDGNYVQLNDIDVSSTAFADNDQGLVPIGGTLVAAVNFTGSYDGQDHAIKGLVINRPSLDAAGLFRTLGGRAVVKNLALKGGAISAHNDVGALVGMSDNSTVLRSSSTASVTGFGNVGGLVGSNHSGLIQESEGHGDIVGLDTGGAPQGACGAVAGFNMGTIRDCLGSGAVDATVHWSAGGLAGTNIAQGIILRSFASGAVSGTGTTHVGGLVGDAADTSFVQTSFWDTQTSGQSASSGGTGRTTVQMMQQTTFNAATWDFTSIWGINEAASYPYLRAIVYQITPPLAIAADPANISGPVTGSVQFTVQTSGGLAPLTYKWQRNQVDLTEGGKYTNTGTATLTVSSLALADSGSKYRCVVTDNASNSVISQEATLTVIPAPTAVTSAPTANFATRADLAGTVNGFGLSTAVTFLWGTASNALNQTVTALESPVIPAGDTVVSATISGLTGNTTYYYRVRAATTAGTTLGTILSFKTPVSVPPAVVTQAATTITRNSAMLKGTVNPRFATTMVSFDYGLTTSYGSSSPGEPHFIGGDNTVHNVLTVVMGLLPHTKYNYRVKGSSDTGVANGVNMTFTTLNGAPITQADSFEVLPSSPVTLPVLLNDSDPDGDTLAVSAFTQPAATAGTVAKVGAGLVFTPKAGFTSGSFNYTVSDGFGGTHSNTVTLTKAMADLDLDSKHLAAIGGTYPVVITTGATWAVTDAVTWVSASPTSGTGMTTVNITVQPNTTKVTRSGNIFIGGLQHAITQDGVLMPQISLPATIPAGIVSGTYSLPIPTVNGPVTYTVAGLPKGLTMVQATGTIGGKPQAFGDFPVTVKATNAAGTTPVLSFTLHILATPASARGAFTALIPRDAGFNDSLGGMLTLNATSLGSLTGTLKMGTSSVTLPATGQLEVPVNGSSPTAHVVIPRTGKPAWLLDLVFNSGSPGHLTGSVTVDDVGAATVTLDGYRHPWTADAPAGKFAGRYTAEFQQLSSVASLPQGSGFAALTSNVNGVVAWAGKLADGTTVSGSTTLWPAGEIPIFQTLYSGKGSMLGAPQISTSTVLRTLGGTLSWSKKAQVTRAYADGFDATSLNVHGGAYVPPEEGEIVNGLADVALGHVNADITFNKGGIETAAMFASLHQQFRLTSAGTATFAAAALNPATIKITSLSEATGVFAGTFSLIDPGPVTRAVTFEGVLLYEGQEGAGYFLLPQLPVPPALPSSTPQLSGRTSISSVE